MFRFRVKSSAFILGKPISYVDISKESGKQQYNNINPSQTKSDIR